MAKTELCMTCRAEKIGTCPIQALFEEIQSRVPTKAETDDELDQLQKLTNEERLAHQKARERGCLHHNDFTLAFPKIRFQ